VRTAERLVLYTIIPVSLISSDRIALSPPYLTSVREIMSRTGTKTARTVNRYLDNLVAAGWLSVQRPANGTLVFTPATRKAAYATVPTTASAGDRSRAVLPPEGRVVPDLMPR
jgi:hypothetical protein